jgi:hypothetical protein
VDPDQPRSIRELLTTDSAGVAGVLGGEVSPDAADVLPVPVPEALDTLPAASNARTVYE